jgi:hypothetical protein
MTAHSEKSTNVGSQPKATTKTGDSWNPLDAFIETYEYPLARIYRDGFWAGIADTYSFFVGNHYDYFTTGKRCKGILDILIFPLLSQWLMGLTSNANHNTLLRIIAGIPAVLLEIPRGLLGGLLTVIASPIVAIVHAVIANKARQLKKQINDLCIGVETANGYDPHMPCMSVLLDITNGDLSEIYCTEETSDATQSEESIKYKNLREKYQTNSGQPILKHHRERYELRWWYHATTVCSPKFFSIKEINCEQALQAFKELNIGRRYT